MNVNVIDAYASASNDFEMGRFLDDFCGDLCLAANDDGMVLIRSGEQIL